MKDTKLDILHGSLPEKEKDDKRGGGEDKRTLKINWPVYTGDSSIACQLPWKWSSALKSDKPGTKDSSSIYYLSGFGWVA